MKAKKSLVLFLVSCLVLCMVLCLGVAAHEGDDHASEGMSTHMLVSLIIGGVVLVGVAVFCIIKREMVAEAMRAYKRELKNITWFPWKQVVRSTIFVVVTIVVVAAVIGLLDILFFNVQNLLTGKGLQFFGK